MTDLQKKNSGTSEVREALRFDEARLSAWMTENVDGFRGPFHVSQFKGGQSNPTYKLTTATASYVLRRKPPGKLLKGAHAIEREAFVLMALEKTGYPIAPVYGLCTDDTVIGTWFYIMKMIDGRIFWDATMPTVPAAERPAYYGAMNENLANLHSIDYQAIGLANYGKLGNYFERQIARWTKQYVGDLETAGRDSNMDNLVEWLPNNIPAGEEYSIVHGDFRIDNLIFHPTRPQVLAVLDWELSTIGHPLADFAYNAMIYRIPPGMISGLAGFNLEALNIPPEEEYVAMYCQRTGRTNIPSLEFYFAFNMFRLAAIFHGIKGRIVRGTANSGHARQMVEALPAVAELAWKQACESI